MKIRSVVLVSLAIISFGLAFSLYYLSSLEEEAHNHPLIAIYPSVVSGHDPDDDTEQFLADLDLVKELGFIGVRLHPKDYDNYTYGRVADDLENRGLKFVMVIEFKVTNDQAQFDQNVTYFRNVAQHLVNKPNLLWYALKYPYDWSEPSTQMYITNWRNQTQRMINEVHETDPNHEIFLVSGMIDTVATPPTDFENIDGFGIQPYSQRGLEDKLDTDSINWIDTYRASGKRVYISEWGLQTMENSPTPEFDYGLVTNESMKVELIKEFYDYIEDWDIYWTYFGLHDLLREDSDWGIVYNDDSLKPSGVTFKELLTYKK